MLRVDAVGDDRVRSFYPSSLYIDEPTGPGCKQLLATLQAAVDRLTALVEKLLPKRTGKTSGKQHKDQP